MSTARPRSAAREADSPRRAEILAIAAEVFREKGVLHATVRDIADRAGILSGSLYHHFESKEQMIEEILTATGEPLLGRCREIEATTGDRTEALRRCLVAAVEYVAGAPNEATILRNDARAIATMPRLSFVQRRRRDMGDLWVSIVQQGQRRGEMRQDVDPTIAVSVMWDAVLSCTRWLPPGGEMAPGMLAEQLADLFVSGLAL
jgi:TetR/AcrR family transcriptional regulator, cholesterol catabolism regulator